ncbi:MAG: hypothetical protein WA071_05175 [Undibacterium umbellatum]
MARKGLLKSARAFKWQWSNGSEIDCHIYSDAIELRYATIARPMQNYRIEIGETICNYGGTRSWFICPYCQHRSAKLYLKLSRFACRCCQRLRYQSQALDPLARNQWSYSKLQKRLIDGEIKPKGMHWRTYERIKDQLIDIDIKVSMTFDAMASQFMQRYPTRRKV